MKKKISRHYVKLKGSKIKVRCACGKLVTTISTPQAEITLTCPKCQRMIDISARSLLKCPECGNTDADGDAHGNCDMVYGRRGWRQLGVYDG